MDIARSLLETLKSLCRILEDARVDHCLIGGLAVGILGKPRATEDIDMLVLIDEAQMPSLMSRLREHLKVIREGHVMHFPEATIWRTVIGSPTGEEGDVVVVDFLAADADVYRKAVLDPIKLEFEGVTIKVARPEHLITMKQMSGRPQDLLDIASLTEGAMGS
jgi:predicted nucleotidyltransferase